MHHRNLQCLAIESYKVKSGNAPFLMNEIFKQEIFLKSALSRIYDHKLTSYHNSKSVRFGTETLRALGLKIWNIIPLDVKNSVSLAIFKQIIKSWTRAPVGFA